MRPPQSRIAERQTHALQSSAPRNPTAAAQSQTGRACSSPAKARRTSEPRSCGVAATARSTTQTIPTTTSVRFPPGIEETPTCLIEAATHEKRGGMRRYASVHADLAKFDRVDRSFQTDTRETRES